MDTSFWVAQAPSPRQNNSNGRRPRPKILFADLLDPILFISFTPNSLLGAPICFDYDSFFEGGDIERKIGSCSRG
jgi:hypothetical protein